ncbi:MAG: hypothetical protein IPI18_08665 [Saprospiraceae bacterium]|nr:hypothetical protein [Saprospiraceae bacterium]
MILSILLLIIAALNYPGGNIRDIHSKGYSLNKNYISHLLEYHALNGMDNLARPWGILGVEMMGITTGLAFVRFANKIDLKKYSSVIRFLGYTLILVTSLITIPPWHDPMITLGSIITLLLFFYVTVLFLQSKLKSFKILSVLLILCFYGATYMYFTRTALDYLPAVQKSIHVFQIGFILGLEHCTSGEDFPRN